jgi:N-acylneuraminate cytidylyltransferase
MEYAKLAQRFGAEAPFLRPTEISQDLSTDFECFQHAVTWLKDMEGYTPDIIVQLRPTYPTRTVTVLDACIETFLKNMDSFDSLRTVVPYEKSPYKMYRVTGGYLKPLFMHVDGKDEPHNMCRQALPPCYVSRRNV